MSHSHEREVVIFEAALELPPEQRRAYLEQACAGDVELLQRIKSLLKAQKRPTDDFLARPAARLPLEASLSPSEKPGDRIGPYKLLQQIGEGGCGIVYMAEQETPIRRRVALKVIKLGMDTRQVIARFEAEQQALALMDHPNIAKVHDAGATETGRPYFVMELVRGVKITDYCDDKKLSTQQRLELFIQVCQAVQHAHQKGIIHRDLKPSNILITVNDGVPTPKVIDFGIAKATTGEKLTDKTVFTAFEQFIGTPAYMSPEQADISSVDIDTRSDIYSLGVLLYELLTGQTPFDTKELLKAGLNEMRRTLREKEPPRPSTRLSTLGVDALTTTANHRHTEAPKLVHVVRGDLDWIAMKCLEKDRSRRYETANGLRRDILRHLNSEPILARPPSRLYEFSRTVRRHRVGFAAVAAVIVALLLGLGASFWSLKRALAAEQKAITEALKSKQVAQFLEDTLQGVGPSVALGRDTTMLRDILDKNAERVGRELTNAPEVEAELLEKIAEAYVDLGEGKKAEPMARKALAIIQRLWGDEHTNTANALELLAVAAETGAGSKESVSLLRKSLAIRERLLGRDSAEVAASLHRLAYALYWNHEPLEEVEKLYRDSMAINTKVFGNDGLPLRATFNNLAIVLKDQGKLDDAEVMFGESLRIGRKLRPEHNPDEAMTLFNLGELYVAQGKLQRAEEAHRDSLGLRRKVLGDQHPDTLISLQCLARVLENEDKLSQVEQAFNDVVGSQPRHGRVLATRGDFFASRGRWQDAIADFSKATEIEPTNSAYYHSLIPLLVTSGNAERYRKTCRMIMTAFGDTTEPVIADRVAKDCLIMPYSGVDVEAVAKLAEIAVRAGKNHRWLPYFQFCRGLANLRQRRFDDALGRMNEVLKGGVNELQMEAYMVLAMAQYQLQHLDEARSALSSGIVLAETHLPALDSGNLGPEWRDRLIAHALMKEAKELIGWPPPNSLFQDTASNANTTGAQSEVRTAPGPDAVHPKANPNKNDVAPSHLP